ncbi:MAG: glycosyl hydrolase family protein [Opitutales bacterium]|nr:glycosyl hydrolase family protein [Opitutales bacterium]
MTKKLSIIAVASAMSVFATNVYSAMVEIDNMKTRPVVQVETKTLKDEAPSYLPAGKKWKLVWHDEFNGKEIDKTKWMCRESFWGQDFPAFAHNFEGVEMTGKTVRLHLLRKGNDFCSPHLQTGSLTYDLPKDSKGFWPFGKLRKPLFMHKYGYYEIRCKQPKSGGWHSAFWLQAPGIGSNPDPSICGVETDIMENYRQHKDGKIVGGNGWGGYGRDSKWFGHFAWHYEADKDGWCYYGVDWSPKGYTFYANGKKIGEQNAPVSNIEQFVLVSTEPAGYRRVGNDGGLSAGRRTWGKPDPKLFEAVLPDFFEVDFVRVYDEVPQYVKPAKKRIKHHKKIK